MRFTNLIVGYAKSQRPFQIELEVTSQFLAADCDDIIGLTSVSPPALLPTRPQQLVARSCTHSSTTTARNTAATMRHTAKGLRQSYTMTMVSVWSKGGPSRRVSQLSLPGALLLWMRWYGRSRVARSLGFQHSHVRTPYPEAYFSHFAYS